VSSGLLRDRVLVVTGGSRGLGRAIVLGATADGAKVVFCGREAARVAEVVHDVEQLSGPGRVVGVVADVSSEADVERLFDTACQAFGGIDVAINNAAVNRAGALAALPVDTFEEMIAVNLSGAFLVSRRALREFLASSRGGRIVTIGSVAQNGGSMSAGYALTKGALAGLTRALAREYGPRGIQAHLLVCGFMETSLSEAMPPAARHQLVEHCPLRRAGTVEEIAAAALFLASGRAQGLNGHALHATGGFLEVHI
jgi:3-oxoacyl-[acyl-carrier protein] reductase